MLNNKTVAAIPDKVIAQITDLVNQANLALQPYVTTLTIEDRKKLPKMSDKTESFVRKTVDYSASNPEFVPSFMDPAELSVDFQNSIELEPVFQLAQQLCTDLNDTAMAAGSEAYQNSLKYYNNVKQGDKSGVPHAHNIYQDLQKRFSGRGKKAIQTPPSK